MSNSISWLFSWGGLIGCEEVWFCFGQIACVRFGKINIKPPHMARSVKSRCAPRVGTQILLIFENKWCCLWYSYRTILGTSWSAGWWHAKLKVAPSPRECFQGLLHSSSCVDSDCARKQAWLPRNWKPMGTPVTSSSVFQEPRVGAVVQTSVPCKSPYWRFVLPFSHLQALMLLGGFWTFRRWEEGGLFELWPQSSPFCLLPGYHEVSSLLCYSGCKGKHRPKITQPAHTGLNVPKLWVSRNHSLFFFF